MIFYQVKSNKYQQLLTTFMHVKRFLIKMFSVAAVAQSHIKSVMHVQKFDYLSELQLCNLR